MKSKFVVALFTGAMLFSSLVVAENDAYPETNPRVPTGGLGTAVLSAVVNADGTLARGSGVTTVDKYGTGNYGVKFRRNVRNCAYVASIGLSGSSGTESNASIDVVGDNASANGVFVDTEDFAGTQADRGFHLIVFCNN
jgi:hypothetical protein